MLIEFANYQTMHSIENNSIREAISVGFAEALPQLKEGEDAMSKIIDAACKRLERTSIRVGDSCDYINGMVGISLKSGIRGLKDVFYDSKKVDARVTLRSLVAMIIEQNIGECLTEIIGNMNLKPMTSREIKCISNVVDNLNSAKRCFKTNTKGSTIMGHSSLRPFIYQVDGNKLLTSNNVYAGVSPITFNECESEKVSVFVSGTGNSVRLTDISDDSSDCSLSEQEILSINKLLINEYQPSAIFLHIGPLVVRIRRKDKSFSHIDMSCCEDIISSLSDVKRFYGVDKNWMEEMLFRGMETVIDMVYDNEHLYHSGTKKTEIEPPKYFHEMAVESEQAQVIDPIAPTQTITATGSNSVTFLDVNHTESGPYYTQTVSGTTTNNLSAFIARSRALRENTNR